MFVCLYLFCSGKKGRLAGSMNKMHGSHFRDSCHAPTSIIANASISKNGHKALIYMYTNFGSFIKKCTICLVCWTMPLHYKDERSLAAIMTE